MKFFLIIPKIFIGFRRKANEPLLNIKPKIALNPPQVTTQYYLKIFKNKLLIKDADNPVFRNV